MAKGSRGTPKIDLIQISDFRAFPAVAPARIELKGRNLLVFGENGSGKSSIYRALRGLFAASAQDILPFRNVFTDPAQPSVKVILTDKTEHQWSAVGHPTAAVRETARRSAFLSHQRLIEMSTGRTANDPPDLFQVAVETLLADFEAIVGGGIRRTVGELWDDVKGTLERRVPYAGGSRRPPDFNGVVEAACAQFNEGMNQALEALETHAKALLRKLLDVLQPDALDLVGFTFFGVKYDAENRQVLTNTLTASVKFRDHSLSAPPNFLNEARLSALAIAIYLAGRLASVPMEDKTLKLLVLDDLLISLDYSHRRPVLEVVAESFKAWQIILLTHDRFWFELAREQLLGQPWKAVEIYENVDGDGLLRPLVWDSQDDLIAETLKQAERFLKENQPAAAANYARTACELTLRRYCRNHNIAFGYADQLQKIKLDVLIAKVEADVKEYPERKAALAALKGHKRLILNPLSHDPTQPVVKADVAAAIEAVKELGKLCKKEKAAAPAQTS